MRKKIHPILVALFFLCFTGIILTTKAMQQVQERDKQEVVQPTDESMSTKPSYHASSNRITNALEMKPIIDVSGWQRPSDIDYDTLSSKISGAIIRVQSGSHTKKDNSASDENGLDKHYQTHIKEFQARGIPVAVYAYVTGNSVESMKKEAKSFYEASYKFKPTYYWLDVEDKTMDDMNAGVEAFRQELEDLGVKNIGIYIGTYFMEEHQISVEKFTALWIPTYGTNSGYYNAAPATDLDYDLHQYTSVGSLNGFSHHLDLNLITTLKDPNQVYQKLFTSPE
ncbi:glycoside hydrolase family 25 protein [Streptococcus cuniculi]|uniref:Glycosyl hydrolase family 25 n=1 Tax=Streptococcus cuniculi TaxID=1432788 RepID=A0A4Y9JD68_9STRE|nr:glycoside hydrolase family 25 protein [Streptococcus cuniculi]MBF0777369.1 glycosyl hydrolase family 25 [Streptococcus cuniculi]TFU98970.1 glycosyl hydrolase family 25 [Streptococcus cuniculi]